MNTLFKYLWMGIKSIDPGLHFGLLFLIVFFALIDAILPLYYTSGIYLVIIFFVTYSYYEEKDYEERRDLMEEEMNKTFKK